MSTQKEIRIEARNGVVLRIPRTLISHIVIPTAVVNGKPFRLNVNMDNYERTVECIRRKVFK